MRRVEFVVPGVPAPQGSKTPIARSDGTLGVLEGKGDVGRGKHKAWREAVAWKAAEAAHGAPFDGPLLVSIEFRMPMPKSRPAAVRRRGHCWHAVKPDIDKLVRSTLDGLVEGGLIVEDSRIAQLNARAYEVWEGAGIGISVPVGATVRVSKLAPFGAAS